MLANVVVGLGLLVDESHAFKAAVGHVYTWVSFVAERKPGFALPSWY